jgi:hypothetical protein
LKAKPTIAVKMLRQVHPNALRSLQHKQASDLLDQCNAFHTDYDTLKYEFAPNCASPHLHRFYAITGKDEIEFAILRDRIIYLVETTKDTLEGRSDASHTEVIRELNMHLEWVIRKTKELKNELEGDGHRYRDGKPRFLVLGASKEPELEVEAEGEGLFPDSSGKFELRSFEGSVRQPSTPVRQQFGSQ